MFVPSPETSTPPETAPDIPEFELRGDFPVGGAGLVVAVLVLAALLWAALIWAVVALVA